MPDRVFEQEYLAKFLDDAGGVFEDVRSHVEDYGLPVDPEDAAATFAIGVDFARFEDWTVIVVLDADGRLVAFRRMRETTWYRIQSVVEQLADQYTPNSVAVDATRDNKIVADLEDAGLAVEPVNFSASRKRTLIDNLITALEGGELTLSSDAPQLINELEVFEFDRTESGKVRYSAPSGFKDDCVDALALAVEAREQAPSSEDFMVTAWYEPGRGPQ
jgi:phage FluMu gp28-like protein